ncbi:Polar amino acid transport system permease protein [Bosea sp. 62]|uniref:amino acid ABC transporter permease n=1 Tax=unclassified Bosea (in: a-proteobacteria) TaxID=2653178 RepID=UPI001251E17E|nr:MULTISPECIES: amino acid ABC transporter permease [unclassified Bosea (in: a-proteobacteria)]CAD5252821.1 Polar amino acid transport system permease protein [Bosea sp. 7B]CAD5278531.1 Polar amino acid transport system permease protein [Bosea sp. 21B]CAD5279622.1 Polar amino acid transport system permease protein [Bosea sp. 46]VVT59643.1 Polar amino acid transport system permease protein [Bosea sp. EC-HK365B]VXB37465.1 Polar amino acid transport system permease protein [Bosea sp. 62]
MKYGLQFRDVFAAWQSILDGVWITLLLSAVAMVGGLAIGILCAAARTYGPAWLRRIVGAYVEIIRNTPLLVQLFLIFFGLPSFGVRLDGLTAAMIALVINLGAYTTEIVRAGLEAVPKAQIEAGHSLGLSGLQVFRYIVVFPALKAMFPALASQFVLLMLATSVASQISVQDLFHAASIVQSRTFRDFEVYTVIGVLYLALAIGFRGLFALIYRVVFVR